MSVVSVISLPLSGIHQAALADWTPGDWPTRFNNLSKNAAHSAGLPEVVSGDATRAVNTLVRSKPGGTFCKRRKLSTSNPAVESSNSARTISTTTRAERRRRPCAPSLEPRALSLSEPAMFGYDARQAGKRPAKIPTMRLAAPGKGRTGIAGGTGPKPGKFAGG